MKFVKRIIVLLCFVTLAFAYEFRFWVDLDHYVTDIFFPGTAWITTARSDFARAAGPYAQLHPDGRGFPQRGAGWQMWMNKAGHWEKYFKKFRPFGMTKGRIISIVLILCLVMTLARRPQIGAGLAMSSPQWERDATRQSGR